MFLPKLFLIVLSCNAICILADPVVTLPDGTSLKGAPSSEKVTAFKGIRYAAPPVDSLRWAPTVPYVNPDTSITVAATEYGSICTQPKYGWRIGGLSVLECICEFR